jgi:molybdopterin/thiamine biosynthesis adenylyltransferase
MDFDFSDTQLERYARHIILPEVGGTGQARLLASKVLVIGAGGLGTPLLHYLAAAGVGTIGIADNDTVGLSNLQRQVIHRTQDVGRLKTKSAAEAIALINPDVRVIRHDERITVENATAMLADYDIIADGSDNFATRFLVNDACYFAKRTLVFAAILRFDGQLATFKAHEGSKHPCYRCIFREPPPPGMVPSCAEGGVLGAIAGAMGSLQAVEVIKELLGIGESLSGTLVIYDALATAFRNVRIRRDPACPLCGDAPSITDLSIHRVSHGDVCEPA